MVRIQENGTPSDDLDPDSSREYLVTWEAIVEVKGGPRAAALEAFRMLADKQEHMRCFVVTRKGGGDPVVLDLDQDL